MSRMIAVFALRGALMAAAGLAGAQDAAEMAGVMRIAFTATSLAGAAGMGGVTGTATVDSDNAYVLITLNPDGAEIPAGTVLEGWMVDPGVFAGAGSNVSVADQIHGPPFGDLAMDVLASAAHYALSTGVLNEDPYGNWSAVFHVPNYNFSPYDLVVITAESDGNMGDRDPRPGAPFFTASMAAGEPAEDFAGMKSHGEMLAGADMMRAEERALYAEVALEVTPLAANAGLEPMTGSATLWQGELGASIDFHVDLKDSIGPDGCLVLEGWVVDAGRFGGPGTTNSYDGDEALGIPFGDETSDATVEAAPYALSAGVAADMGAGTLGASIIYPGYNFAPYDAFMVTLESDCNAPGFDPRPGTPLLIGMIEAGI